MYPSSCACGGRVLIRGGWGGGGFLVLGIVVPIMVLSLLGSCF